MNDGRNLNLNPDLNLNQPENLRDLRMHRLSTREQLEQWTGVVGNQMLSAFRKSNQANREAEDRAARRQFDSLSGSDSTDVDQGGTDVGDNVVLGGIHNPPAVVYPPHPPRQGMSPIAAALLTALVAAGGAYLYQQQQSDPSDDTSIRIGLGKE